MNNQAKIAIQAARLRHHKHIGRYAAQQYAFNRGVHPALFRLACQLEAIKGIK